MLIFGGVSTASFLIRTDLEVGFGESFDSPQSHIATGNVVAKSLNVACRWPWVLRSGRVFFFFVK